MSDPIPQDISLAGCNSTEEAIIHIVGLNHPIKWPIANSMTAENLARTVAVKKLGIGPVVLEVNIKCTNIDTHLRCFSFPFIHRSLPITNNLFLVIWTETQN